MDNIEKFQIDSGDGKFVPLRTKGRQFWTNDQLIGQLIVDIHNQMYGEISSNPDVTQSRLERIGKDILPLLYPSGLQAAFKEKEWGGEFSMALAPPVNERESNLFVLKGFERETKVDRAARTERFSESEAILDIDRPDIQPITFSREQNIDWRVEKFRQPLKTFYEAVKDIPIETTSSPRFKKMMDRLSHAAEIDTGSIKSYKNYRDSFWNPFIKDLRLLCRDKPNLSASEQQVLETLVKELYSNTSQKEIALWLMPTLFKEAGTTYFQSLESQYEALKNAATRFKFAFWDVTFGRLAGTFNYLFDPIGESGNIPYLHSEFKVDGQDVRLLRIGTPATSPNPFTAQLGEEFPAYIDSLQPGEKHLYVNNQRRFVEEEVSPLLTSFKKIKHQILLLAERYLGVNREEDRAHVLEAFAEQHADKLTVATVANDGPLYDQSGEGWEVKGMNYSDFKKRFVEEFVEHESYRLPEELKAELKEDAGKILDFLYETMFKGKEEARLEEVHQSKNYEFFTPESDTPEGLSLSRAQRKDMIEHLNSLLTLKLVQRTGATSFNITCKDAIDRGGKNTGMFTFWRLLMEDKWNVPEEKGKFFYLLHAPGFLIKSLRMVKSRSDRFDTAFARVADDPEVMTKVKAHPMFAEFRQAFVATST